ncbi:hypothetical protein UlMin_026068 [Ulmus minor]
MGRLSSCAKSIHAWGFRKFGRIRSDMKELQKDIELRKADDNFENNIQEVGLLEKCLEALCNMDKIYWKQRSRMDWMTHGDRNSNFFHHEASERRKKNMISRLFNDYGVWNTDAVNIHTIISGYFLLILLL